MSATLTPSATPAPTPPPSPSTDETPLPSEWFYSIKGVRHGPVPTAVFKQMIDDAVLKPDDRVYGAGMTQWAFVREVKDRLPAAIPSHQGSPAAGVIPAIPITQAPGGPDFGASPNDLAYYNPTGNVSRRALQVLKGFPPPTGPTGPSPLKSEHLDELHIAAGHRKALLRFHVLCHVLTLVTLIFGLFPSVVLLAGVRKFGRAMRGADPTGMFALFFVGSIALIVLYQMAGRAALKARAWGPIAVLTVLGIGFLFTVGRALLNLNIVLATLPGFLTMLLMVVISVVCIFIAARAIPAAPRFLDSPVWCQEALVYARF